MTLSSCAGTSTVLMRYTYVGENSENWVGPDSI